MHDAIEMEAALALRALDAMEIGVLVLSKDLEVLHRNSTCRELLGDSLPAQVTDAIENYVVSRRDTGKLPPAMRLEIGERVFYLRVVPSPGQPPVEVMFVREESLRDVDRFRVLNGRYGISRREFQILAELGLGKTNRHIADTLGLSESTVARHVHNLLQRLGVSNRTRLVNLIDRILSRRD